MILMKCLLFRPQQGKSFLEQFRVDDWIRIIFFPGVSPRAIDILPLQGKTFAHATNLELETLKLLP